MYTFHEMNSVAVDVSLDLLGSRLGVFVELCRHLLVNELGEGLQEALQPRALPNLGGFGRWGGVDHGRADGDGGGGG